MLNPSKIDSSEYQDLNKVIAWFIRLRWVAVAGVLATLLVVDLRLSYALHYTVLYPLLGVLLFFNTLFTLYFTVLKKRNLTRRETMALFNVQIGCDYALLLLLAYFTGFLENPFIYFFVFHIMMTSFIFSSDVVFLYVGGLIAVLVAVFFAEYYRLIPHFALRGGSNGSYFQLYLPRALGLCSTLMISAYLITAIKDRIAEKGRRVEVELDRYKNLDKIKSNFILQVTHELRGPIAAMNGYHEMILRGITGEVPGRTTEVVTKANRRTENLLQIIDEMLDYAYMKSEEEVRYTKTQVLLKEIIDGQLEVASGPAEQKGIRLVSNCGRELRVWSSRDLLNIILANLINNAVKYSPCQSSIAVNAAAEGKEVHLMVKDEGYGIPPEEMDNIFEEFYRTRHARELERDGTGLGLPIVKRAVESLNGRITVYSEVDKGTTFHIFFPREEHTDGGGDDEQDTDR